MLPRSCVAFLLALAVPAAAVAQPEPASFGQRLGDIYSQGGSTDALQGKLSRLSREATSDDQRLAVEAFGLIIRGMERDKGLPLPQAEAFAAQHPESGAALVAVGHAALNEQRLDRSAEAYGAAVSRSPWLVDVIPASEIDDLIGRLVSRSDGPRLLRLGRTMLGAGWTRGSPVSRSYLASVVIQDELRAGRIEQATGLMPEVTDPGLLYALMADKRFAAVRPEIERLWGSRLETRWRDYLAAYRDDWMKTGSRDAAVAYAFALQQANHHQVLVDQFLPRFVRGYNCWDDPVARQLVGYLVTSLNKLGRGSKAQDLLGRMGSVGGISVWAGPSLGSMLLSKGDFDRAARIFELSIKQAAKFPGNIPSEALVLTQARLACANHQRDKPTQLPATDVLSLSSRLWLALCMDDVEMARSLLLSALGDEDRRLAAIEWLQPFADPPFSGRFAKEMDRRVRALQADPVVLAAVARYGFIHNWALESSAPPQSEFKGLQVRRASPCSSGGSDPMDAAKQPESLVEKRPGY